MNRLRKALSIDNSKKNKKRFSLFSSQHATTEQPDALPRLSVSSPCVEYPPEINSAIELNTNKRHQLFGLRSAHSLTSFDENLVVSSTLSPTREKPLMSRSLQSIHSSSASSCSSDLPPPLLSAVPPATQRATAEDTQDYLQLGMKYHEKGELEKATHYWRLSAEAGSPLGLFFYGIALRHGWGCKRNTTKAVRYLQSAAECAVYDLQTGIAQSASVAKSELVLAIYELGVCFRHGWGVPKNLETATYYFQVASNLGDPDAQNDLGFCYAHGLGVKKDLYCAAKYYRLAEKQGQGMIGNSWIWKEKYNQVDEPGWKGKVKK
ncbi:conserved hypothetical protein [Mucor ambiguus]|uniref:HCP-like protein n=1 Tax=Mucor ambiguus TaxID=91626 RepID=A0A0C9MBI2_9FUNG|nr:conserved hypothetical protein [Mucor ambiguus]